MIILSIKTDNPQAEIGLFENSIEIDYISWEAHRELSTTIHKRILSLLEANNKSWSDLGGIVFFSGPGSFTGLRIGASVANALASSLKINIAGSNGEEWIKNALIGLSKPNKNSSFVVPEYGEPARTTKPKK